MDTTGNPFYISTYTQSGPSWIEGDSAVGNNTNSVSGSRLFSTCLSEDMLTSAVGYNALTVNYVGFITVFQRATLGDPWEIVRYITDSTPGRVFAYDMTCNVDMSNIFVLSPGINASYFTAITKYTRTGPTQWTSSCNNFVSSTNADLSEMALSGDGTVLSVTVTTTHSVFNYYTDTCSSFSSFHVDGVVSRMCSLSLDYYASLMAIGECTTNALQGTNYLVYRNYTTGGFGPSSAELSLTNMTGVPTQGLAVYLCGGGQTMLSLAMGGDYGQYNGWSYSNDTDSFELSVIIEPIELESFAPLNPHNQYTIDGSVLFAMGTTHLYVYTDVASCELVPPPVMPPVVLPPVEAPITPPIEPPVTTPVESPIEPPADAPVSSPLEAPVFEPVQPPTAEVPVEAPISAPVESPVVPAVQPEQVTPAISQNNVIGISITTVVAGAAIIGTGIAVAVVTMRP
jgi:hypothetical protein